MTFCSIIPDDMLKRIGDKRSLEASKIIRDMRQEGLQIPPPKEHQEVRVLYDAKGSMTSGDIIAMDVQTHSTTPSTYPELQFFNIVYDFIHDGLNRESYDNKNAAMRVYKNVGHNYNNAFWDGAEFKFGNGDQETFRTFWIQSVATHEAFHAVTEWVSGLMYLGESGALNESISDVFAVAVDQLIANHKPLEANWLIGEGVFMGNINGKSLRTFKNELAYDDPWIGKDPQAKHMKDYYYGNQDNGGVHINSGIPNHAFYQFCMLTGENAWQMPLNVWWNALCNSRPETTFKQFAQNTITWCLPEYRDKLYEAWQRVGITPDGTIRKENPIISFLKYLISLIINIFKRN